MARADTYTLLSLDRWARIMGIDPSHFNSAAGATYMPVGAKCSDLWYQFAWQQTDRVAREDLAHEIKMAEEELANLVGYWAAPMWNVNEVHPYPRPYRRDSFGDGSNARGMAKSVFARYAKVVEPGRRALTLIGVATSAGIGATITFADEDGDTFLETAIVTLPTTYTDIREIHTYFPGFSGSQSWEVRPPKSISIAGGSVVIKFWVWQIIEPDLWDGLNSSTPRSAINIEDPTNYTVTLEVYREYTDPGSVSSTFYWEPGTVGFGVCCSACGGTGCSVCALDAQDGCLVIRDVDRGILVPNLGTYDRELETWSQGESLQCREPDQVKVWYRSGDIDQLYLNGTGWDPLKHYWAEIIAWMATARLERAICACANALTLFESLRVDLSRADRDGPTFTISEEDLNNPFGTRAGEVRAWKRVRNLIDRRNRVAVV